MMIVFLMVSLALFQVIVMGPQQIENGQVINLFRQKIITQEQLYDQLSEKRVVLVGETHNDPNHHKVQLKIIQGIYKHNNNMAIGLEMIPRHLQSQLDRWVADELSREDFLKAVDWDQTWGFDSDLYMPILRFARDNNIHLVAMNIKREVVKQVRLKGLDGVADNIKDELPKIAPASDKYKTMLREVFESHPMMSKMGKFENFVDAQQVWDGVMATQINHWLGENPYGLLVGLAGSGHISYGNGIPHQLKSQGVEDIATVLPWNIEEKWADYKVANYAWGVPKPPPPPVRFGIMLQEVETGVLITTVFKDSIAEKHGIKAEDEIRELNGETITTIKRLKWLIKNMEWGDKATLTVNRDGDVKKIELELER
ncbi:MAG: ChaN family lipoprotein [Magnetococcales bacterium]|nr:ChaN family lipoprotein [Magnetococcales bacterium]